MSIGQFIKRLFTILRNFAVRSGFDKWLAEHWDDILMVVLDEIRNGAGLTIHAIQPRLFAAVKRVTGVESDNWAALAVGLAIETAKAKGLIK